MSSRNEQGFTLIELLIVVAIISVIASMAVPGLLSARRTGNETSAITSLRTTAVAQTSYSTTCGNGGYAPSYQVLGVPPPGSSDGFLSADLAKAAPVAKAGYNFDMAPSAGSAAGVNDCNGTPTISAWLATAVPQSFGSSGSRSFAVNGSITVWQSASPTPPTEPFTQSATVMPVQ
jgi:prepilin-type N-terminal cleavage/methylation domain-containing protein